MGRWTEKQAWQWYNDLPWLCGFNYVPRTAVNWTEMWQKETFDLATIEQELAWARDIGYNTLRTVLPFIVWQHDRDGLWQRLNRFLDVAEKNGLRSMISPLDDCEFSGDPPQLGPQPPPIPGVHNSRAVGSPGRRMVMDTDKWPEIASYVKDVVSTFQEDARIFMWDLYNEPGNSLIFKSDGQHLFDPELEHYSYELMLRVFEWAREVDPPQPLTTAGWHVDEEDELHDHFIDVKAFELSDIITFHAYCSPERMKLAIDNVKSYGRPVMCTEWMGRQAGSRIEGQLPMFHRERVGNYHWGLVKGKTQTHIPWPGLLDGFPDWSEGDEWFHNVLHPDGTRYSEKEIALIRELVGKESTR